MIGVAKLDELSKQINNLTKEGKWPERNKLAAEWRKLFDAHDFELQEGQKVEYWDMKWKHGTINKIRSNMEIMVNDVIVSASLIRDPHDRYEQTSLF